MSPTSYQTAPPRVTAFRRSGRDDLTAALSRQGTCTTPVPSVVFRYSWLAFFLSAVRMRLLLSLLLAVSAGAGTLPGFRVEKVADVPGFVTSVVVDSRGVVYCTTTDGWIHRVDGTATVPATVPV